MKSKITLDFNLEKSKFPFNLIFPSLFNIISTFSNESDLKLRIPSLIFMTPNLFKNDLSFSTGITLVLFTLIRKLLFDKLLESP